MSVVSVRVSELRKRGLQSFEDWLTLPNSLYIGRKVQYVAGTYASKWGNPYIASKHPNGEALKLYESYVRGRKDLINSLHELHGQELGCWCVNDPPNHTPEICHGQVLLRLMREFNTSN
jgi:hypothetical protein